MTPPVVLTIAGSDSGGGAGVQADLATFAGLGAFGTSAITAVTAQDTVAVRRVHTVPVDVVVAQIEAVLDDLPVAAVKTGMLATAAVVEAIAELAAARRLPRLVVDPVMVSSSGARLLDQAGIAALRQRLLMHCAVVTPNLAEAEVLLGEELRDVDDVRAAARSLAAHGPRTVVITGGHTIGPPGPEAIDVVYVDGVVHEVRGPRVDTRNDHGTGCAFSAAIACGLAAGLPPLESVQRARVFVERGLRGSVGWQLGSGRGPLDHLRKDRT